MSWELRCFKNRNGCSNLQIIRKQGNMGKEWEAEVNGQNQEQETFSFLAVRPAVCVTRVSQKGNGRFVSFYSETLLQQTTENT